MQLNTQYRSPTPQTMASVAPLTTPDTNTPQPQITRPMPSITMQAVHSGVGTEAFGACGLSRWIAAHPLLAAAGLVGLFFLVAPGGVGSAGRGRKANPFRRRRKNPWLSKGDIVVSDPDNRQQVARAKKKAQAMADRLGRPVQIDFWNRYTGGKPFRAPLTQVRPRRD